MKAISLELQQSLVKLLKKILKQSQSKYVISDVEVIAWLQKLLCEQLNVKEWN